MKNCIIVFVLIFSFSFAYSFVPGHEITFEIKGIKESKARLGSFYGAEVKYLDSAIFNTDGQVIFKGEKSLPEGLYLLQFGDKNFDFIVSEQKFSFKALFPNLEGTAQVVGSQENKIYLDYKQMVIRKRAESDSLKRAIKRNPQNTKAKFQLSEIDKFVNQYRNSLQNQYPGSLACKMIKAGLDIKPKDLNLNPRLDSAAKTKILKSRLFDNIDLTDARLIRAPFIEEQILKYLKLTPFNPDSLEKSCDEIISKMKGDKEVYRFGLICLMNHFEKNNRPWMDVTYSYLAKTYYLTGGVWIPDSSEYYTVKANTIRMAPLLTGKIAPAINFLDTISKEVPLYSVKAKYTILYFWDADCKRCQETTPKLWDLYTKFRPRGVEVYAVTVQQIYYSWLEYVKLHKLNWVNVWEPEKIPEIYKTYQIGTTPTIFLLDRDKRILCKRISLEKLEMYLNKLAPI